jgi:hypothetical protein
MIQGSRAGAAGCARSDGRSVLQAASAAGEDHGGLPTDPAGELASTHAGPSEQPLHAGASAEAPAHTTTTVHAPHEATASALRAAAASSTGLHAGPVPPLPPPHGGLGPIGPPLTASALAATHALALLSRLAALQAADGGWPGGEEVEALAITNGRLLPLPQLGELRRVHQPLLGWLHRRLLPARHCAALLSAEQRRGPVP